MIQQYWINNHYGLRIFMTTNCATLEPQGVVLTLSGLGFSKNERAYFYSKLSRRLSQNYIVVQFDYTGHGDSDGDFSDATVPVLIEDVLTIVKHIETKYQDYPINIISRGIGTWLVSYLSCKINQWVVWNPALTMPHQFIEKVLTSNVNGEPIEISDLPCSNMPAEARLFFEALGSDWWNVLRGERFSVLQLQSLRTLVSQKLHAYMDDIEHLHFLCGSKWKYLNRRKENLITCPGEDDFSFSPMQQEWAIEKIKQLFGT
ncbi:alpha/beta hydrolase [Paenibacillus sp. IB182496]|uniref:Alpha/beta hydrolase n=1 Tax=Paenibacillus sabuli TaxID=2772509 RepID=A0A927BV94_9BACL|nr:alpha/beta hydrolase [Paenibacillus sabuli]MBD2847466.1 alpha/beta hydrolase [Paenibacillus sabuli]